MLKSLFNPKHYVGFKAQILPFQCLQNRLSYIQLHRFSVIQENEDASKILELVEAKIFQTIKSRMKTQVDQINRASTFEELGFDSLDAVDIIVSVEESLKLNIQDEEALGIQTVNDSIAIFHRYMLEKFNRNKLAEKEEEKRITLKRGKKEDHLV